LWIMPKELSQIRPSEKNCSLEEAIDIFLRALKLAKDKGLFQKASGQSWNLIHILGPKYLAWKKLKIPLGDFDAILKTLIENNKITVLPDMLGADWLVNIKDSTIIEGL